MKKIALFILILSSIIELKAQDFDLTKMYILNPVQINTAFAFKYSYTTVALTHTQKWADMPESPQQYGIYLIIPFQSNMGIQGSIFSSEYGFLTKQGFRFGYFYHTRLNNGTKISMSLTTLVNFAYINKNAIMVEEPNDPLINSLEKKHSFFNFNTGIHLEHNNWDLGFAAHNIIPENYKSDSAIFYEEVPEFYLYSSYSFSNFSGTLKFIPSLMANYHLNDGLMLNINQSIKYKDFLLLGIGYLEPIQMDKIVSRGLAFYTKIKFFKRLAIGFLYETYLSDMRSVLGNYQAAILSYSFVRKQKTIPSYF